MRALLIVSIMMCFPLFCGCASSRMPRLGVYNATDTPVSDVVVRHENTALLAAPALGARAGAEPKPVALALPATITMEWTDSDGTRVNRTVPLEPPAARGRGRVRIGLQIQPTNAVKAFVTQRSGREGSAVPWGYEPGFDGAVSIPGLAPE